ncbi:MAG: ABC transporter permease [Planctomycetes bacterium]|nr:ABC transporter permease [Planctomycetota bacterium]
MRVGILHRRSLAYHWRTNVGVVLGVAVGTAVLTGALIVGDSMRGSLREAALGRLGRVDQALVSTRFFREALATEMTDSAIGQRLHLETCPAILLSGGSVHAESQARSNRISILGVDERFWELGSKGATFSPPAMVGRSVVLNGPLATELGAAVGDDILLRIAKPSAISTETLLGRRDDTTTALRLTVASIIPAEDIGAFSLNPRQWLPRNACIPLSTLQRALGHTDRRAASGCSGESRPPPVKSNCLRQLVQGLRERSSSS